MLGMEGTNFRLWSYMFGALIVLLLVWLFRAFILTCYANFFFIDNASKGADAIIILSGGKVTRTPKGIDLWQNSFAPLIFLTDEKQRNSDYQHLKISNLEFARRVANILILTIFLGLLSLPLLVVQHLLLTKPKIH